MCYNTERIVKLTAERDALQKALDDNIVMGGMIDISKGNERLKNVSPDTLESMIRRKEMQIIRAGGTL